MLFSSARSCQWKWKLQQQDNILFLQPVSMGKEPSHCFNVFSMQNCRRSDILKVLTFVFFFFLFSPPPYFFFMNQGIHFLNLLTGCVLGTTIAITIIIKCFKIWKFYIEYSVSVTFVQKKIVMRDTELFWLLSQANRWLWQSSHTFARQCLWTPHFHLLISYFKAKILKDFAGKDFFSHRSARRKWNISQFY